MSPFLFVLTMAACAGAVGFCVSKALPTWPPWRRQMLGIGLVWAAEMAGWLAGR